MQNSTRKYIAQRRNLRCFLDLFIRKSLLGKLQSTMNSFFHNGYQYQLNYPANGHGLMHQAARTPLLSHVGGLAVNPRNGAFHPQICQLQFPGLDKTVALGIIQQQLFVHNFAFVNSERYHPRAPVHPNTKQNPGGKFRRSSSVCELSTTQGKFLKQLRPSGGSLGPREGSVESVASQASTDIEESGESYRHNLGYSTTEEDSDSVSEVDGDSEDSMFSRGIK